MKKNYGFKIGTEFAFGEEEKGIKFQKDLEEDGYKTSSHVNDFGSTVITVVGYK